jgi:hypothetical protein
MLLEIPIFAGVYGTMGIHEERSPWLEPKNPDLIFSLNVVARIPKFLTRYHKTASQRSAIASASRAIGVARWSNTRFG